MSSLLKCPECNGDREDSEKDVEVLGNNVGRFKCGVCKVCGLAFLDDEAMKQVFPATGRKFSRPV